MRLWGIDVQSLQRQTVEKYYKTFHNFHNSLMELWATESLTTESSERHFVC